MHPPLFRPHPKCGELVDKLVACHEEHKMGKFFGYCNDPKAEMDICFRAEKEEARHANMLKARAFDERLEEHMKLVAEARAYRDKMKDETSRGG
jgi:COX assembly mitochondrial protein 2